MPNKKSKIFFNRISPCEVWADVKIDLDRMNDEEREGTLKNAGILTKSGKVASPYRSVIRAKAAAES